MQRQATAPRASLATGRGMGFGPFKPTPVRAAAGWLHAVTVDGAVPISLDSLDGLLAHVTARIALDDLRRAWGERVSVSPGSLVVARAVLLEVKERLDPIL